MKIVGMNITNQIKKEHGYCAEKYKGERSVPLPARGKGGFSKSTKHRMGENQAVKGSPYPTFGENGTEAD